MRAAAGEDALKGCVEEQVFERSESRFIVSSISSRDHECFRDYRSFQVYRLTFSTENSPGPFAKRG